MHLWIGCHTNKHCVEHKLKQTRNKYCVTHTAMFVHNRKIGWVTLQCRKLGEVPAHPYSCLMEKLPSQATKLPGRSVLMKECSFSRSTFNELHFRKGAECWRLEIENILQRTLNQTIIQSVQKPIVEWVVYSTHFSQYIYLICDNAESKRCYIFCWLTFLQIVILFEHNPHHFK